MKIEEIKRYNFYTDGKIIVFKSKNGKRFLTLTEPENNMKHFCDRGVSVSYIDELYLKGDFRKVEQNESFFKKAIVIMDSKNIEIYSKIPDNAQYDNKGYIINGDNLEYEEKFEIKNINEFLA